jgi:hypothetical protein
LYFAPIVRYRRQTDCHPGYEWLLIVTGSHRLPQTNICKCAKSLSLSPTKLLQKYDYISVTGTPGLYFYI